MDFHSRESLNLLKKGLYSKLFKILASINKGDYMKTLKIFVLLAFFTTAINVKAQDDADKEINWITFEEAIALNKENPKPIFIDLYTDWCGWGKKMDQSTFKEKDVAAYMNENFYNVKFDAEQKEDVEYKGNTFKFVEQGRRGYHELAAGLLQGKMSYPSFVVLNKEEQIMQIIKGYQTSDRFLPILKALLEKE